MSIEEKLVQRRKELQIEQKTHEASSENGSSTTTTGAQYQLGSQITMNSAENLPASSKTSGEKLEARELVGMGRVYEKFWSN